MPITVTGPNGQATMVIGPGSTLFAQTDFIGPIPSGSVWTIAITSDPEGAHVQTFTSIFDNAHAVSFQIGINTADHNWNWTGIAGIADGAPAYISVELLEPGDVAIDSGITEMPYSIGAAGEAWQVAQPESGGLTPTESQQLQETTDSSALVHLYNFLSQEVLTPSPSGGPVLKSLQTPVYGCIVRLVDIPPEFVPTGPDDAYWVKTLAVVRVFSGNDCWLRAPIHTPTKIVSFWGEHLLIGLAGIVVQGWFQDLRLLVEFLPGVTGTVILLHLPP